MERIFKTILLFSAGFTMTFLNFSEIFLWPRLVRCHGGQSAALASVCVGVVAPARPGGSFEPVARRPSPVAPLSPGAARYEVRS